MSRLSNLVECIVQRGILAKNVDRMTNLRRLFVYSEESAKEVVKILTDHVEKMSQLTSLSLPLNRGLTADMLLQLPSLRFAIK